MYLSLCFKVTKASIIVRRERYSALGLSLSLNFMFRIKEIFHSICQLLSFVNNYFLKKELFCKELFSHHVWNALKSPADTSRVIITSLDVC